MKLSRLIQLSTIGVATLASVFCLKSVQAGTFEETQVDQSKFAAIARPFGTNQYDLLIIEQVADKRDCWSEVPIDSGTVIIEPLLLNFDFTGICQRSTDSNGYSMRVNGQDLGLDYMLNVVEKDGELVLVGVPRSDRSLPEVVIGSTHGMSRGFLKIHLNPGWVFTKRTFNGNVLGHVYLSTTNSVSTSDSPGGISQVPAVNDPLNPANPLDTPTPPSGPTKPTLPTQPGNTRILDTPTDPMSPVDTGIPVDPTLTTDPLTDPSLVDPTLPVDPSLPTTP